MASAEVLSASPGAAFREHAKQRLRDATALEQEIETLRPQLADAQDKLTWIELEGPRTEELFAERRHLVHVVHPAEIEAIESDLASDIRKYDDAYREIERAQSVADAQLATELSQVAARLRNTSANGAELGNLPSQRQAAQSVVDSLVAEKERVITELRMGLFCSQCGRSKSEIEKQTNDTFEQHLIDVRGHAVAKPEQIQRKSQEYSDRIDRALARVADIDKQIARKHAAHRRELDNLANEKSRLESRRIAQSETATQRLQENRSILQQRKNAAESSRTAALARHRDTLNDLDSAWRDREQSYRAQRSELGDEVSTLRSSIHAKSLRDVTVRRQAMLATEHASFLDRLYGSRVERMERVNAQASRRNHFESTYNARSAVLKRASGTERRRISRAYYETLRDYPKIADRPNDQVDSPPVAMLVSTSDWLDEYISRVEREQQVIEQLASLQPLQEGTRERLRSIQQEIGREITAAREISGSVPVPTRSGWESDDSQFRSLDSMIVAARDSATGPLGSARRESRHMTQAWISNQAAGIGSPAPASATHTKAAMDIVQDLGSEMVEAAKDRTGRLNKLVRETGKYWLRKKTNEIKGLPVDVTQDILRGQTKDVSELMTDRFEESLRLSASDIKRDLLSTFRSQLREVAVDGLVAAEEWDADRPFIEAERWYERAKIRTKLSFGNLKQHFSDLEKSAEEVLGGATERLGREFDDVILD